MPDPKRRLIGHNNSRSLGGISVAHCAYGISPGVSEDLGTFVTNCEAKRPATRALAAIPSVHRVRAALCVPAGSVQRQP
jgi:hypothetical protein